MPIFTQEKLDYAYDALGQFIDSKTMKTHYEKHHAGYIEKLNKELKRYALPEDMRLEQLLSQIDQYDLQLRNYAGGHYNHALFWKMLTPKAEALSMKSALGQAIIKRFGSFDLFKGQFSQLAAQHFGSGWAWLSVDKQGCLQISSTPNQDNPLMCVCSQQGIPILGIDVWEHAYYLRYLNDRKAYIHAFWSVVNWKYVSAAYLEALK